MRTGLSQLSETSRKSSHEAPELVFTPPQSPDDKKAIIEKLIETTEDSFSDASPCMTCSHSSETVNPKLPPTAELLGTWEVLGFTMSVAVEGTPEGSPEEDIEGQKKKIKSAVESLVNTTNFAAQWWKTPTLGNFWGGKNEVSSN